MLDHDRVTCPWPCHFQAQTAESGLVSITGRPPQQALGKKRVGWGFLVCFFFLFFFLLFFLPFFFLSSFLFLSFSPPFSLFFKKPGVKRASHVHKRASTRTPPNGRGSRQNTVWTGRTYRHGLHSRSQSTPQSPTLEAQTSVRSGGPSHPVASGPLLHAGPNNPTKMVTRQDTPGHIWLALATTPDFVPRSHWCEPSENTPGPHCFGFRWLARAPWCRMLQKLSGEVCFRSSHPARMRLENPWPMLACFKLHQQVTSQAGCSGTHLAKPASEP